MNRRMIPIVLTGVTLARVAAAAMSIRVEPSTLQYTILEGDRPVLTYNFGTNPVPTGVSGIYAVARGDYVHPLYGPSGEILTMDFSPDHPHHRGIYWAWPEVTYQGVTADLHALQNVFARPARILEQRADGDSARIAAENVWMWKNTEPIVKEIATITAHRAEPGLRRIDFNLRFEALKPGVTIARRHRDAYGGFNVRMSARQGQQIVRSAREWAELRGVPPNGKEPIGVLILQSPQNPSFPGDWIDYPNLNWLQPTFPAAGTAYALDVGKVLQLRFQIVVRSGAGLDVKPETIASAAGPTIPALLESMMAYDGGAPRATLAMIEEQLRQASRSERRTIEQQIADALSRPGASGEFKRWALKQLAGADSDAALRATSALLADNDAWMQAADVLYAIPGGAGLAALRAALLNAPAGRQPALINLLAMRRDPDAVPLLQPLTSSTDSAVAAAAFRGLGDIGTASAARALLEQPKNPAARDAWADACLRAAAQATQHSAALYQAILDDPSRPSWQRGAALCGEASLAPGKAVQLVRDALASEDAHLRNSGVAALRVLSDSTLAGFRDSWATLSDLVRIALVRAWGDRGVKAAEPELIGALSSDDERLAVEAVRALRAVGASRCVAPLLSLAAKPGESGKEALVTLAQLSSRGVADELRGQFASTNAAVAVAAIRALSARREKGLGNDLLNALSDPRVEVARCAATELRAEGAPDALPRIRTLLLSPAGSAIRAEIAQVVVAICKRQPDANAALGSFLDAAPALAGEARAAMLPALPAIGGAAALSFATRIQDEAAVRALLNWPDSAALEPLLAVAASNVPLRDLAAAGYVRLAQRVLPPTRRASALSKALPYVADKAEQQRLADIIANSNLALNAAVTGSRPPESGHPPGLAVDGNATLSSYWSCTPPPAALTVDLLEPQRVDRVNLRTFWDGARYYQYIVEASANGSNWTCVADMRTNTVPATAEGVTHRFPPLDARYLRATLLHNSANPGMHIVELEAFAPAQAEVKP